MKSLKVREKYQKLNEILGQESSFYFIAIVYGVGVSVLTLAIPISVQSLVNTVTFGLLTQPLIVLSILLLALLLFSGVLNALQTYVIELFQRRFYARTTAEITEKLVDADYLELTRRNGEDLVNRYFDVMTVQKSVTTLLTGGTSMILQTLVGLVLLAFYHPYFLVFDILLLILLWLVWRLFGQDALRTASFESQSKYDVASWLREIARGNMVFKSSTRRLDALKKSDKLINQYLDNRRIHFKEVFYQTIFLLTIYAVMSALILGLGGYLVIDGQLTLGQLVAAELVVTVILASFSRSGKYLEAFYDLVAAVEKISYIYDIPAEKKRKTIVEVDDLFDLNFNHACVTSNRYEFCFDYNFKKKQNYYLTAQYHSSKLVFVELLKGLIEPDRGDILFGNNSLEDISLLDMRDEIYIVDEPVLVEGTIRENLSIGKEKLSQARIQEVLELVDLGHIDEIFEEGIDTKLLPSGHPMWSSQLIRLEIARAILAKPKVLILSAIVDQIEEIRRERIINYLLEQEFTFLMFSHKSHSHIKFDKYLLVGRKYIYECDTEEDLQFQISSSRDGVYET